MKSEIQINNSTEVCQIDIEGTIGIPEAWQFDQPEARVATYEKFRDALALISAIDAAEVVVNIRSTGGDVNDALLIHDALVALPSRITTRCYGYTASAATIIAQAASAGCREISANALYLIHNSVCATEGNAEELGAKLDLLHQTDERLAAVYSARSGVAAATFTSLMTENNGCGRWLSPDEAIAAGLADRVIDAPAGDRTLTKNLVRGWERLLTSIGMRPNEQMPDPRNILHFDEPIRAMRQRSQIAAAEARAQSSATKTLPREDPSYGDAVRSINDRAYDNDARRFQKNS